MERFRYEHLQVMMPLYKRRVELERSEEEDRINRAARFPLSSQEYRAIEVRAAQLRVAHFLMHDESKREQMRTESRWAWRQTQPLIDEYRKDVSIRCSHPDSFLIGIIRSQASGWKSRKWCKRLRVATLGADALETEVYVSWNDVRVERGEVEGDITN